jgi:hypothetical protein
VVGVVTGPTSILGLDAIDAFVAREHLRPIYNIDFAEGHDALGKDGRTF